MCKIPGSEMSRVKCAHAQQKAGRGIKFVECQNMINDRIITGVCKDEPGPSMSNVVQHNIQIE